MLNQHHLYCWLQTGRRWPRGARTPSFHVSHTGNSPDCAWVCFQPSPLWRCSHPGADSGVCWMTGTASDQRGSPALLGQAMAWAESNSRQLIQTYSRADNNCSYRGLYQLGGVSRVSVGCGEAFRGMSPGSLVPVFGLSVPAMCPEKLATAGRVLQPCVSWGVLTPSARCLPWKGPFQKVRAETGGKWSLFSLESFLWGESSIKVGFFPVPFPKQGSKENKTNIRKPQSHLIKQNI